MKSIVDKTIKVVKNNNREYVNKVYNSNKSLINKDKNEEYLNMIMFKIDRLQGTVDRLMNNNNNTTQNKLDALLQGMFQNGNVTRQDLINSEINMTNNMTILSNYINYLINTQTNIIDNNERINLAQLYNTIQTNYANINPNYIINGITNILQNNPNINNAVLAELQNIKNDIAQSKNDIINSTGQNFNTLLNSIRDLINNQTADLGTESADNLIEN